MKQGFYLAIEGNIGSGKTTLSQIIAKAFNARLILEEFEENPFLKGFYNDPERYSFSVEMAFLADRYHQLKKLVGEDDLFQPNLVADYAPFKSLLFAQNNLKEEEFKLYRDFWQMSLGKLPQPDFILYLTKPIDELLRNIKKRGRTYEQNIQPEYLRELEKRYINYLNLHHHGKIIVIEAEHLDFIPVGGVQERLINYLSKVLKEGKRENFKEKLIFNAGKGV